jgi:membrane protease YdiL (CAAX protease family)
MNFHWKNPAHLFAGFMLIISFFVFLILPLLSLVMPVADMDTINQFGDLNGSFALIFEIVLLILQLIIVILLFILVPFLWYRLVNNFSIKQILQQIKLKKQNLDMAFLWGIITAIIALSLVLIIGAVLSYFGIADENASNIEDLELFFSIPAIFFLITVQPIAEEIFFRGFLLDKFEIATGKYPAIIITSVLFGLAHISMGNVIPAIIISIVAVVFGYMVIRTRNLMVGIFGHVIFNLISFVLYLIGKEILTEGIISFI